MGLGVVIAVVEVVWVWPRVMKRESGRGTAYGGSVMAERREREAEKQWRRERENGRKE
uniref:Uncharacterized protein n=1 Tax=Fagus sylvatica TaxID=28930 RepID=A0A2N9F1F8_FAGSY